MAGLNRSSSNPMRNLLPPQELLDDLCSRFVLNVPKEDLESFERILFLLEQAHWFYEDNAVEQNPSLKSLSFKEFTSLSILLDHFIFFPSVSCWSMIGFYWYLLSVSHLALGRFTGHSW